MLTRAEGVALVDLIQAWVTAAFDVTRVGNNWDAIDIQMENSFQAQRKLLQYILSITDMTTPLS